MKNETMLKATSVIYPKKSVYTLARKNAASFFDPLISVQKLSVVGLEALYRTADPNSLDMIGPQDLFRNLGDGDFQEKLGLDRLFRRKALEGFRPFLIRNPRLILFLEIESSILGEKTVGSGYLHKQVLGAGMDPSQLAVQIALSRDIDANLVQQFIQTHRENGFLVSLKGINESPAHREYIERFNPDLVKLEESMVQGVARNPDKQKKLHDMVKRAHDIGIVVITGGLDNEEDALAALEIGVDLLQGSYFTQSRANKPGLTLGLKERLDFLASRFRRLLMGKANRTGGLKHSARKIADAVFTRLQDIPADSLEREFHAVLGQYPALECLYLLSSDGVQISETVCSPYHIPERKRFLFKPAPKGTNHSLEEHYYALTDSQPCHLTESYLSMNSGNLCVTASKMFLDKADGQVYHLCADLNVLKV